MNSLSLADFLDFMHRTAPLKLGVSLADFLLPFGRPRFADDDFPQIPRVFGLPYMVNDHRIELSAPSMVFFRRHGLPLGWLRLELLLTLGLVLFLEFVW